MRRRAKPRPTDNSGNPLTPVEVFRLCISRVRKRQLKARLQAVAPLIGAAAQEFDAAADAGTLHTILREAIVGGDVTNEEMVKVYTGRMLPTRQPGRPIYDSILGAPEDSCPLCGIGVVRGLDHHLPKGEYSRLVVVPNNLVPACEWCQSNKRAAYPTVAGDQTIHPYFDNFETVQWLKAIVLHTAPASFKFSVDSPARWSATKSERARHHLKTFNLGVLFSSNAAGHLVDIRHRLFNLLVSGGAASVKAHLIEEAASRRAAHLNSWATAMYEAAASDAWFFGGGFTGI
jgi:hypothetical protein